MPKISVIIPLYNKAKYIGPTLDSVMGQTLKNFEVIVVDDGSTDGSGDVVRQFSSSKIRFFQQENKGASSARNKAMQEATGKYFAFLDADDFWKRNHLEEINNLISHYPEEKVFATAIELEDSQGTYPAPYSGISPEKYQLLDFFDTSYGYSILSGSSTVIKREAFQSIGFFDEKIKSGQDTDYWIRLGLRYPIAFNNVITVRYKWIPESLSRTSFNLENKTDFTKFDKEVATNKGLAKYISLNLFSFWIKSKIAGDEESAIYLKKKIQKKFLSKKQLFLLNLSGSQLLFLYKTKEFLKIFGFRISAYGD